MGLVWGHKFQSHYNADSNETKKENKLSWNVCKLEPYHCALASQEALVVKNPGANAGDNPWVGKISWRRAWQSTPIFLPEESHGQRSLAGCSHRVRHDWGNLAHMHQVHTKTICIWHVGINRPGFSQQLRGSIFWELVQWWFLTHWLGSCRLNDQR